MKYYPESAENVHIVVAAGSGSRYGADMPKQFCDLWGRPLLMTTLERLHSSAHDARIIVVLSADMVEVWREMCAEYGFTLPHDIVTGGPSRAHSVKNAVDTLCPETVGWVTVHDAARPMVTGDMMGRLLAALDDSHRGDSGSVGDRFHPSDSSRWLFGISRPFDLSCRSDTSAL